MLGTWVLEDLSYLTSFTSYSGRLGISSLAMPLEANLHSPSLPISEGEVRSLISSPDCSSLRTRTNPQSVIDAGHSSVRKESTYPISTLLSSLCAGSDYAS